MATAATLPKTIFITTLPAPVSSNTNYVQCRMTTGDLSPKIGSKRSFSIVSSSPLTLTTSSSSTVDKSPNASSTVTNADWLPATVQRAYKYETVDDDYEYGEDSSEDRSQYSEPDQPPRKRERLTHLTADEKMFRRKMKNRIAAQTARDRKKALMVDLEETVRRLEEENDTLLVENSKLIQERSSLVDENEQLKKLLSEQQQPQSMHSRDDARAVSAFGPAESINVPLPKERAKAGWALTWLVASALIQLYSKYCVKSSPPEERQKMLSQLEQLKENGGSTLEEVISRSPPEAIEKLWTIIRSQESLRTKPP